MKLVHSVIVKIIFQSDILNHLVVEVHFHYIMLFVFALLAVPVKKEEI